MSNLCYTVSVTASNLVAEGRCAMVDMLLSFIHSVLASVVACYLCKWLDGDE